MVRASRWLISLVPLVAAHAAWAQVEVEVRNPGDAFIAAFQGGDIGKALPLIEPETKACIAEAGGEKADRVKLAPCVLQMAYYGMTLLETGKASEAVAMGQRAAEVAADFGIESDMSVVANMFLGQILERQGQHGAAEVAFRTALQGAEKVLAGDSSLATYVARRANNLVMLARYAEALPLAERAIALADDDADRALFRLIHGRALQGLGRLHEAEAALRAGIEHLARATGADGINTVELREQLALCLEEQNRTDEAIAIWRATLAVRRARGEGAEVANSLTGLGSALMRTGQLREAEAMMREALTLRLRYYGEASNYTGMAYSNLGLTLMESGQYDEAALMFSRAIAVLHAAGGASPDELIVVMNNLAVVMVRVGAFEDSVNMQRQVIALAEGNFGPSHSRTMLARNNLAAALSRLGQRAEAVKLFSANYEAARALGGQGAQWRAIAASSLAVNLAQTGDRAGAKTWHARAEVESRTAFRVDHRDRINIGWGYGVFLIDEPGGLPLARTLLREAGRQVLSRAATGAGFDARAQDELSAFTIVFRDAVRAAWRLAPGS